ncbi:flagellar export protein FliJ [Acanthopleuribacter pedis]|uniref:Flagellar FliJ protein n=1 Tax=Acanthopleuribacter pedis TaxID=442870 RepID=A0A8J7Q4G5_9BACT|nr:flagellar FliJ family protein [Acanthopleuribacter pedis]MBO1317581.1 flagellar FliJ family protein [Acanthopleuribacter pedis]
MKKFQFRLESVLKVRGIHRKQAERDLAIAQTRVTRTRQALEETQQDYQHSFLTPADPRINPHFWRQTAEHYREGLRQREAELTEQLAKQEKALEQQRENLALRMKEEKAMEKLKEGRRAGHQAEVDAQFQKEIEELDLLKRGKR